MNTAKWPATAKMIRIVVAPFNDDIIDKDELAKVLGVTRTFVNALLRGDKSLPPSQAQALADFYMVDFEEFRQAYIKDVYQSYEPK